MAGVGAITHRTNRCVGCCWGSVMVFRASVGLNPEWWTRRCVLSGGKTQRRSTRGLVVKQGPVVERGVPVSGSRHCARHGPAALAGGAMPYSSEQFEFCNDSSMASRR